MSRFLTILTVTLFLCASLVASTAKTSKAQHKNTKAHAKMAMTKSKTAKTKSVKKHAAEKPAAHKAAVHKASLTSTSNGFESVSGHVVKANIENNTLVLSDHGKDMSFQVPGRIDMLNLKTGERVSGEYIAEGRTNRLWELKAN